MFEGACEENIFIFYYLVIQNQILYITSLSLALIDLFLWFSAKITNQTFSCNFEPSGRNKTWWTCIFWHWDISAAFKALSLGTAFFFFQSLCSYTQALHTAFWFTYWLAEKLDSFIYIFLTFWYLCLYIEYSSSLYPLHILSSWSKCNST